MLIDAGTKIYIAGMYDACHRLVVHRDRMRALGLDVSSNWMDTINAAGNHTERIREATRDMREVQEASIFILDTLDQSVSGGRESELGFALAALNQTYLIGPERQIFHSLIDLQWESWEEFFFDLLSD